MNEPISRDEAITPIGLGIFLSILTLGLYAFYWQYKQMKTVNAWLGREELSFGLWLLLSFITCGIFAVYYEYKMAKAINEVQENQGQRVHDDLAVICLLVTLLGFWIASVAIQQADLNNLYGENPDF